MIAMPDVTEDSRKAFRLRDEVSEEMLMNQQMTE
jgi:hypothetical protein